jgi:hypothetical protein
MLDYFSRSECPINSVSGLGLDTRYTKLTVEDESVLSFNEYDQLDMYGAIDILDNLSSYDEFNSGADRTATLNLYVRPIIPYELECEATNSRKEVLDLVGYDFV